MRQFMRQTYAVFTWLFLAAVVVQFFLAGLGVFVNPEDFGFHAMFGGIILLIGLLALALSFAAALPWRTTGLTALLPALVLVQVALVELGHAFRPVLAAFHVINALVIFSVAGAVALHARSLFASHAPVPANVVPQLH
jgi:hypothetical protein